MASHLKGREDVLKEWEGKLERKQRALDAKREEHAKWVAEREQKLEAQQVQAEAAEKESRAARARLEEASRVRLGNAAVIGRGEEYSVDAGARRAGTGHQPTHQPRPQP